MHKWFAWGVVALLGCSSQSETAGQPTLLSVAFEKERAAVTLPQADGAERPALRFAEVLLTSKHLLLAGDDLPIVTLTDAESAALGVSGLPTRSKQDGPHDVLISQLYQGLQFKKASERPEDGATIVLLADRAAPFRTLFEIAHTAGQTQLRLAVGVAPKGDAAMPVDVRLVPTPRTRVASKALNLKVVITSAGIRLKTTAGNIADGCESFGGGVTIPKKGGAHDFAALTGCAKTLKGQHERFRNERTATLNATPATKLQTIVDTMVALHAPSLFPDVAWELAQ